MSTSETHLRRPAEPFDPLACASLHNEIIAILKPFAEQHNFRVVRNYFDAYGDEAVATRNQLSLAMITFFENIEVILSNDPPPRPDAYPHRMNIAPHLRMPEPLDENAVLPGTSGLWDEEIWVDEGVENWVVIYQGLEQEHALYFNMDLGLCTWHQELMPWTRNWYPLDRALRLWLSFYRAGKFQPSYQDDIYSPAAHRRYIPSDLDRDLKAYHELLSVIQSRCPGSTISDAPGLVDTVTLEEFPNLTGFLPDFLQRARRPSFIYIAPGLRVPSSEWIRQMLPRAHIEGYDPGNNYDSEPLPLFPGPKITLYSSWFKINQKSRVVNNVSGLYSWPDYLSMDAVRLILPSPIGENGWVREGNEEETSEESRAKGVPTERAQTDALYQYGWCPFLPCHLPTLSVILSNWKKLIEDGEWQVGPDGVEGGIEKFMEADTEEHCLSYRIGVCLDDA